MKLKNKKAQEEMIGFALIMIVVAVILLVFLSIALTKPKKTQAESYEVENFLKAVLQYTTECKDKWEIENLSVEKLIYSCKKSEFCFDRPACSVLKENLNKITDESWKIEDERIKAYEFKIFSEERELISLSKGNKTGNFKGSAQILPKGIEVMLNVYY